MRTRSVSLIFANSAALSSVSRTVSVPTSAAAYVREPMRRLARYSGAMVAVSVSVALVSMSKASMVNGLTGLTTLVSIRKISVALSTLRIKLSDVAPVIWYRVLSVS